MVELDYKLVEERARELREQWYEGYGVPAGMPWKAIGDRDRDGWLAIARVTLQNDAVAAQIPEESEAARIARERHERVRIAAAWHDPGFPKGQSWEESRPQYRATMVAAAQAELDEAALRTDEKPDPGHALYDLWRKCCGKVTQGFLMPWASLAEDCQASWREMAAELGR